MPVVSKKLSDATPEETKTAQLIDDTVDVLEDTLRTIGLARGIRAQSAVSICMMLLARITVRCAGEAVGIEELVTTISEDYKSLVNLMLKNSHPIN